MPSPYAEFLQSKQVLQKYRLNSDPKTRLAPILEMRSRPSGMIPAILHLFGLTTITDLSVTSTEVYRHSRGFFGEMIDFMPLRSIQTVSVGISKPFPLLLLGLLFVLGGIVSLITAGVGPGVITLVFGVLMIVSYFMGEKYVLAFTGVNEVLSIRFKSGSDSRSRVDLDSLLDAVDVIRELLTDANRPGGSTSHVVALAKSKVSKEEEEDFDE